MSGRIGSFGVRVMLGMAAGAVLGTAAQADPLQPDDLAFGLSRSDPASTMMLVRGGVAVPDAWARSYIQSVEFDNLSGIAHNARGNLLGVDYGANATTGGLIYNFPTDDAIADSQLLFAFDLVAFPMSASLQKSQLGGLSVSPDNTKIAVTGTNSGALVVFDYTAGNSAGTGATLANPRQALTLTSGFTMGTAWLNANTVLTVDAVGNLAKNVVGATAITYERVATVAPTGGAASIVADIEYNPTVSPYVFISYGRFSTTTTNTIHVLDPRNGFATVKSLDYSQSANTLREIALDSKGNLYLGQYGAGIDVIYGIGSNPLGMTDNNSVHYFAATVTSSYNGIDVATSTVPLPTSVYGGLALLASVLGVRHHRRRAVH